MEICASSSLRWTRLSRKRSLMIWGERQTKWPRNLRIFVRDTLSKTKEAEEEKVIIIASTFWIDFEYLRDDLHPGLGTLLSCCDINP